MDTRYELCFSTDNPATIDELHKLAHRWLDCYTIIPSYGSWKGQTETAYCLTFVGYESDTWTALTLAKAIKEYFAQEAVLVTKQSVNAMLV